MKAAAAVTSPLDFAQPTTPQPLVSRYTFPFKGVSVAGRKPVSFSFSSLGTLRDELGRAGFTDVTTPRTGLNVPVRVNITIGPVTFTGVAATTYKATQGKSGLVLTPAPR